MIGKLIARAATPLGVKIGAMVGGALLGVIALLWLLLLAEQRHSRAVQTQLTGAVADHAITTASLTTCRAAINDGNERIAARGRAAKQARRDVAQARERAERTFAPTARRIDAVRASVGQNEGNACDTPSDVRALAADL